MLSGKVVGFIGAGNMGEVLIRGLLQSGSVKKTDIIASDANQERLAKTVADLKEMGVQYLGVSHCTGFEASAYLANEFGERFFLNNSGTQLTLPF